MKDIRKELPYAPMNGTPAARAANDKVRRELLAEWEKLKRKGMSARRAVSEMGFNEDGYKVLLNWGSHIRKVDAAGGATALYEKKSAAYGKERVKRRRARRSVTPTLITVPIHETPVEAQHDPQANGKLTIVVMSGEAEAILGAAMRALKHL